ncbi:MULTISPECIES: hypothetical protein [Elizabethkingia]|uniref:hypothetical protein n=1 Tax=Elizabethkingia TaxID=308865 RepID=UPI001EE69063|nr:MULTISPECIES: hypothetical protein [Elizabethkingia]MCT3803506.1 hypothetical protein [Elizabethkingia anophelis]MDX8555879.1 hypothetical protein [Elizabethkingia sp. HX CGY]UKY91064.1 hypothetical protein KUF64_04980 [Elizabethkingia anophelis]UKY98235.1 hypothetical protein KUF68_04985 [Elizabethkingia anophelis]
MAITLTTVNPDIIRMDIKMNIPQGDIISFLQMRGYEIKAFVQVITAEESMLITEPRKEIHTFTATKEDEEQIENTLYLKVFEKEIKELLKGL